MTPRARSSGTSSTRSAAARARSWCRSSPGRSVSIRQASRRASRMARRRISIGFRRDMVGQPARAVATMWRLEGRARPPAGRACPRAATLRDALEGRPRSPSRSGGPWTPGQIVPTVWATAAPQDADADPAGGGSCPPAFGAFRSRPPLRPHANCPTVPCEGHILAREPDRAFEPAELCVVVPTLNERGNIGRLIERLERCLDGVVAWEDRGRRRRLDRRHRRRRARACNRADPRVRCLRRLGRRGWSSAGVEGILAASPLPRRDRRRPAARRAAARRACWRFCARTRPTWWSAVATPRRRVRAGTSAAAWISRIATALSAGCSGWTSPTR